MVDKVEDFIEEKMGEFTFDKKIRRLENNYGLLQDKIQLVEDVLGDLDTAEVAL